MPLFLVFYILIAVVVSLVVFLLSYNEEKNKYFKPALTVIYIVSIIGIIFATGYLEARCLFSKIISTGIALVVVILIYGADTLGKKLLEKKNGETK